MFDFPLEKFSLYHCAWASLCQFYLYCTYNSANLFRTTLVDFKDCLYASYFTYCEWQGVDIYCFWLNFERSDV